MCVCVGRTHLEERQLMVAPPAANVDVMLSWAAELASIKNPRRCQEDNSVRKNFSQRVSGTRQASDDAVESPLAA